MTTYDWPKVDQQDLHSRRFARVAAMMREADVGSLILVGPDNIRYATGFRAHLTNESEWFTAVVDSDGQAQIFVPYTDEVYFDPYPDMPWIRAVHPLPSWAPITANPVTWVRSLSAVLQSSVTRIGVDGLDMGLVNLLQDELPARPIVSVSTALQRIRREKDPLEHTLLRAASRVNAGAMQAALAAAAVGCTDHDILAAAMQFQQAAGAEFVTHSVCNVRNGSGDWFAAGRRLREGDAFFFDIGMYGVGGYGSDAARSGFVGEPRAELRRAYEHLTSAHELAQSIARPGVRASRIQRELNAYLEGHGLRGTPYGVGHGIGLRICELPTLFVSDLMDEDAVLLEGEVIALEPETTVIVDDREVVLKIEDNFIVTSAGLEKMTIVAE